MHNNHLIRTKYRKENKTYNLKSLINIGIPESFCVFDHLEKHTETQADFLSKYAHVVELRLQGMSLRKVSKASGVSYATVAKVSTILQHGQSSLKQNKYLQKYPDVVKSLLEGFTQKAIAEKLGLSLATVNTVAKITEIDYIQMNREKGKLKIEKWKLKTKNDPEIKIFIEENYSIWAKKLEKNLDDEILIRHYNEYLKTITIPSEFDIDRYSKFNEDFTKNLLHEIDEDRRRYEIRERGRKQVEEKNKLYKEHKRLKKIEDDKIKKENRERNLIYSKEVKIREQKEIQRRIDQTNELKEVYKATFYKLLDAGINPWNKEWDMIPNEYRNLEFRTLPISIVWNSDQRLIFAIRDSMADFEEYAKNNVKKFDFDLSADLLEHYALIKTKIYKDSYDYLECADQSVLKSIIKAEASEIEYDEGDFRNLSAVFFTYQ